MLQLIDNSYCSVHCQKKVKKFRISVPRVQVVDNIRQVWVTGHTEPMLHTNRPVPKWFWTNTCTDTAILLTLCLKLSLNDLL